MKYKLEPMPVIEPKPLPPPPPPITVADLIARLSLIQDQSKIICVGGFPGEALNVEEENDGKVWIY